MLVLEHGKPMIFGKDRDKGIRLRGLHPEVVTIGEDGVTEDDLLVHDAARRGPVPRADPVAHVLARVPGAGGRPPRGQPPTHSDLMDGQIEQAIEKSGEGDLAKVLLAGETWTVE